MLKNIMMLRIIAIITVTVVVSVLFVACDLKVETDRNNDDMYGRQKVSQMTSSFGFGRRALDDIYTVLEYIYSDEDLCNRFGNDFEIGPDNVSGGAETSTFFIKGLGQYEIEIQDSSFLVKVEKSYWGKWTVTEFTEIVDGGE